VPDVNTDRDKHVLYIGKLGRWVAKSYVKEFEVDSTSFGWNCIYVDLINRE
jgi:hypothetical protein